MQYKKHLRDPELEPHYSISLSTANNDKLDAPELDP